ncbi:MAG: hypothetical protein IGS03_06480 [Candidatus Sericytochromatia bacterium]|nr:hypothetical protein [Candidatus Sericytochromatia bacterium]
MLVTDQQGNYHARLRENEIFFAVFEPDGCILSESNQTQKISYSHLRQISAEAISGQLEQTRPSPHRERITALLSDLGIQQGSCVDIGAYDGLNYSNTHFLFEQGWQGLMLECGPHRFALLASHYRALPAAQLSRAKVTPENIVPLLNAHQIPAEFDLLSLDIDSYDYFVLAALLKHYRPTVILTEINEVIPPPVKFAVQYDPAFELQIQTRFYGQSLAMLAELCQQHGYTMIDMYYMDVVLLDNRYLEGEARDLATLYREGLLDRPRPAYYRDYPFDVEALLQADPQTACQLIQAGFAPFKGRFICEV